MNLMLVCVEEDRFENDEEGCGAGCGGRRGQRELSVARRRDRRRHPAGRRPAPAGRGQDGACRDGEVLISDGPFAETKEVICGYDVLECANLEEAVKVAAAHPVAAFGKIQVSGLLRRPPTGGEIRFARQLTLVLLDGEVERGAVLRRRTNPQPPTVAFDDAAADCQSSACAATASARLPHAGNGFLLLGPDADASCRERRTRAAAARPSGADFLIADLHPAWRIGPGVLDGVADEIDQHFLQPDPVTGNGAQPHGRRS